MSEHADKVRDATEELLRQHRPEWLVGSSGYGRLVVGEREYPGEACEIHVTSLPTDEPTDDAANK